MMVTRDEAKIGLTVFLKSRIKETNKDSTEEDVFGLDYSIKEFCEDNYPLINNKTYNSPYFS